MSSEPSYTEEWEHQELVDRVSDLERLADGGLRVIREHAAMIDVLNWMIQQDGLSRTDKRYKNAERMGEKTFERVTAVVSAVGQP